VPALQRSPGLSTGDLEKVLRFHGFNPAVEIRPCRGPEGAIT
jgi:hypothetical protein